MLVMVAAGLTEAEHSKIFLGRGDSPFTVEGQRSVADAADYLAPYRFDHVWTSDLYRAQATARLIRDVNHHGFDFSLSEELRERSAGSYEGMPFSRIREGMSPKAYRAWDRDPFEAPEHGESLSDIHQRLHPLYVNEIRPVLQQNVLVISHPDTLKVLVAMVRGDLLSDAMSTTIEHGLPYFYYGNPA